MGVRGFRDIPTWLDLGTRKGRAQLAVQLARAEHETARLERELATWRANQEETKRRLQRVQERAGALRGLLARASRRGAQRLPGGRKAGRRHPQPQPRTRSRHEVSLEY